ncbi:hypothetical protein [Clostridium tyrobutyricum]|uniref:hypothetical protein n=1 Tax=Clostridium tyrobutyricum TaxID=1519 RepID=UPI001C381B23|nr:hypothetical protein [Clostridium tyrobutyricum]MBV4422912.1 hypothetical protein [Clostridium tyrobutyricum]
MGKSYMDVIRTKLKNVKYVKIECTQIKQRDILTLQDNEVILLKNKDFNILIRKNYFIKCMQGGILVLRYCEDKYRLKTDKKTLIFTADQCIDYISNL